MLVAVALSGGVDSSVAALLLRERYDRLVGASHLIWPGSRCCSTEVMGRARAVCRMLGVPYVQADLQEEFRREVVDNFVATYRAGRTPNPCVVCNKAVRFDAFYRRLAERLQAEGLLAAGEPLALATGHYARIVNDEDGWFIEQGRDPLKDQSYMLHRVSSRMLPHILLPLGDMLKTEVLAVARSRGLDYSAVRESQDACFVEDSYVGFIRSYAGQPAGEGLLGPGAIVDLQGRELGRHRGTLHYTVGQRHGLGLGSGPWYVRRIEPESGRVVVARREEAQVREFLVEDCNWFIEPPRESLDCSVKIRYQTRGLCCRVAPDPDGRGLRVQLGSPEIVTPGQSAVFYGGRRVLGGGVIA